MINLPLLDIIEYIKSTFDIIISIKVESKIEEYLSQKNEDINAATEYETLLQKLEGSIRQHISYEHQFKIEYEKLLNKAEEIDLENKVLTKYIENQDNKMKKLISKNNEYKKKIEKIEKDNDLLKEIQNNLKEKIDIKEKELIQYQIKLKEINKANYYNNSNTDNYKSKSYLSKSNSSINIYKENTQENKDCNNIRKKVKNNIYKNKLIKIKKKNNQSLALSNLTLSLQNLKNKSNSKTKKKKYNNSINYFNKKYTNNISTIYYIRNNSKNRRTKIMNTTINKNKRKMNSNSRNKSMFNLFPSGKVNNLFNNSNKYLNNSNNRKRKNSSKSFNITHNTYNMNKNNVMINLNTNIINANTPLEQLKVQQKLLEYKKYINKKLNEFSKKNKKRVNNINTSSNKKKNKIKINSIHYKKINKNYFQNKRKISPFMNNIKLNFSSNKSNNDSTKKNKVLSNTNIINTNNNSNSKPNLNVIFKGSKNKKIGLATLKNFVFSKK